jgi:tRNA-splicing ligase RtcB
MPFGNFNFKKPDFEKVSDVIWDIPMSFKPGMRVPGRIVATKNIIDQMDLQVYDQITNVATLPGIINHAYCMADGHSGYGFPIGGVAAFDKDNGVISPGGIGFDINCGMRLVLTNLTYDQVRPKLKPLVDTLFERVPAGVGSTGFVKLTKPEFRKVVEEGAEWAIRNGYGWEEDLERTEENGRMKGADESKCSDKAIERGFNQIGTLGSGNHYLEIQYVKPENIFDEELAKKWGLFPGQVVVMFHCGSRGFGHQVATDYLQVFLNVMERKYGIKILDRELASAPFNSKEGQDYFSAMQCGINMSFANRQVILHRIREVFSKIFGMSAEDLGMKMLYDVAHNTAKIEEYDIGGKRREVIVHRKGATRSLGPGRKEVPKAYRDDGQPVIIGGSMETGSYLLVGTKKAEEMTFGSTAHGSGRTMSRARATKLFRGEDLQRDMEKRGIYVKSTSYSGLAEEAGAAYKNIDEVINAVHEAGISSRVVKFTPIGNVKG